MIKLDARDRLFMQEVIAEPGGKHLLDCWSCGTCTATCLVRRSEPTFSPRHILRQAGLGLRGEVLASKEIWLCSACDACYPRCPKKIHISEVMGAIRAIAIREGYSRPGVVAEVNEAVCSGCAVCTRACPYGAIERVTKTIDGSERATAQVSRNLCMQCGICVAACPSGAMSLEALNDAEFLTRISAGGWLERKGYLQGAAPEPRILALVCQWSLRSDAEWERLAALGEAVRVVNLPCSGRVEPATILQALAGGADGVLVVGCKEGECHYQRGTYLGRAKIALVREMLQQMSIPTARVRFVEVGALDRFALQGLMADMAQAIKSLTPEPA